MRHFKLVHFPLTIIAALLIATSSIAAELNTNRGGSDYRSFFLDAPDFIQCERACADETQCKAWTYVKPGIQGPSAKCWLKHSVPAAAASDCCISGIAGQPTTGITTNTSKENPNTTRASKADPNSWKTAWCAEQYRLYIHTDAGHVIGGGRTGVFISGFDSHYKKYECFVANTYGGVLEIENLKRSELEHCRRRAALDRDSCTVLGDWPYQ